MSVFFMLTTCICGFGWLVTQIGAAALVKYMYEKNYTPPTNEELKACCKDVVIGFLRHR